MEWSTVISLGACVLAVISVFGHLFDKSLSIREHEEFRRGQEKWQDNLKSDFQRETDKLGDRISKIENICSAAATEIEERLDRRER